MLQKRFPCRVNQGFSYIMNTLLYLSEGQHNYGHTNSSVSIVILKIDLGTSLGSKSTTVTIFKPDNKQNHCRLGKNVNMRNSTGSPLSYGVVGFACSSFISVTISEAVNKDYIQLNSKHLVHLSLRLEYG